MIDFFCRSMTPTNFWDDRKFALSLPLVSIRQTVLFKVKYYGYSIHQRENMSSDFKGRTIIFLSGAYHFWDLQKIFLKSSTFQTIFFHYKM